MDLRLHDIVWYHNGNHLLLLRVIGVYHEFITLSEVYKLESPHGNIITMSRAELEANCTIDLHNPRACARTLL